MKRVFQPDNIQISLNESSNEIRESRAHDFFSRPGRIIAGLTHVRK